MEDVPETELEVIETDLFSITCCKLEQMLLEVEAEGFYGNLVPLDGVMSNFFVQKFYRKLNKYFFDKYKVIFDTECGEGKFSVIFYN